jgi:hypothetical protein
VVQARPKCYQTTDLAVRGESLRCATKTPGQRPLWRGRWLLSTAGLRPNCHHVGRHFQSRVACRRPAVGATTAPGTGRLEDTGSSHANLEALKLNGSSRDGTYLLRLVAARSFSVATTTYQHTLKVSPSGTSPRRSWAATWTRFRYCRSTWLKRSASAWIQRLL